MIAAGGFNDNTDFFPSRHHWIVIEMRYLSYIDLYRVVEYCICDVGRWLEGFYSCLSNLRVRRSKKVSCLCLYGRQRCPHSLDVNIFSRELMLVRKKRKILAKFLLRNGEGKLGHTFSLQFLRAVALVRASHIRNFSVFTYLFFGPI